MFPTPLMAVPIDRISRSGSPSSGAVTVTVAVALNLEQSPVIVTVVGFPRHRPSTHAPRICQKWNLLPPRSGRLIVRPIDLVRLHRAGRELRGRPRQRRATSPRRFRPARSQLQSRPDRYPRKVPAAYTITSAVPDDAVTRTFVHRRPDIRERPSPLLPHPRLPRRSPMEDLPTTKSEDFVVLRVEDGVPAGGRRGPAKRTSPRPG